jgi:hypothetical protein
MRRTGLCCIVLWVVVLCGAKAPRIELVVSAPGYPGNTEQAQPTMDSFARNVETIAGWKRGHLRAAYFESEDGGREAIISGRASVALVPLSFLAHYGADLELQPRLLAVPKAGPTEVWALVAGKGRVTAASSLDGWEIASRAGYAPGFVRRVVLGAWDVPDSTTVSFTPRILSRLRKAAAGEPIAVLLDGEQRAALDSLPFANDLEVVFESEPLPAFLACTVGDRLAKDDAAQLLDALRMLHEGDGADVLEQIRLVRFETLSEDQLESIAAAREAAGSGL